MTRIKLTASVVVAVCVFAGLAANASAASKGEFVNSADKALEKNVFTGTSGETKLETVGGTKITCKKALGLGILTSATGGEGTTHFTGCTSSGLSCKGIKPAASAGEIIVLGVASVLKLSATEDVGPGTIVEPGTKKPGEVEFECSGVKIKVRGSSYGNGIAINQGLKTLWAGSVSQTKGVQKVLKDEAGVEAKLETSIEGKAFEQTGVEGSGLAVRPEQVVHAVDGCLAPDGLVWSSMVVGP